MAVTIQETYSSPLVNYVESHTINGIEYTRFFTEVNTDLSVGDYVYILNGNYDNQDISDQSVYNPASNGYKILAIDRNTITLEIPFRSETPWNEDDLEDFTKVYVVNNLDKFNYENQDNGFAYVTLGGDKYSTENNNIFLSQIENLPYTTETQTKDKFFKSLLEQDQPLVITDTKGQVFASGETLSFVLEENIEHGATNSIGDSVSIPSGYNYFGDFDIGNFSSNDFLVGLIGTGPSASLTKFWYWDKTSNVNTSLNSDIYPTNAGTTISSVHYIKLGATLGDINSDKDFIRFLFPKDMESYNRTEVVIVARNGGATASFQLNQDFQVFGLGSTIIAGYTETSGINRTVGFYSKNDTSPLTPSGQIKDWISGTANGYAAGSGDTDPYFILSGTAGYIPQTQYWPYTSGSFPSIDTDYWGVVPGYANFTGIGRLSKVEINEYANQNPNEGTNNMEMVLAGSRRLGSTDSIDRGGLYIYSYNGNYALGTSVDNWLVYLGNAIQINRDSYDYYTSLGVDAYLNPFDTDDLIEPIDDIDAFFSIRDVVWLGVEQRLFDTNLSGDDGKGLYYSKYLLTTESGTYWLYAYFNGAKLRLIDPLFNDAVETHNMPQVHWKITGIPDKDPIRPYPEYYDTIGVNKVTDDPYRSPQRIEGDYPFGRLQIPSYAGYTDNNINTGEEKPIAFDLSDIQGASITDFDFHNERWLVSSADHTPRFDHHFGVTSSFSGKGVFIADRTIGGNEVDIQLTTTSTVDTGSPIPSNEAFKVMGESIGDTTRRVWAATEAGLYMYEYDIDFEFNYYYSVDFENNNIPLNNDKFRNGRILIMEDFIFDGILYEKDKIYRYDSVNRRWVIDETYLQSFLSKANFKDGTFEDGTFDDGIFGNRINSAKWIGADWRNGLLYNSIWSNGIMTSKSDDLVTQSYYARLKDGSIKLTTDFTNNSSFGYNFMFGGHISGGQINNGNFNETQVGTYSGSLLETVYAGNTFSYNPITINMGNYEDCNLIGVEVNNSRIQSSILDNSRVDGSSRILNTEANRSIVSNARIQNKGRTNILGYDRWVNIKETINGVDIIHIHKFFINERNFNQINYGDWVIFNDINSTSSEPISIFDDIFYVLGRTAGFYNDIYDNINTTIRSSGSGDTEYEQVNAKIFVSKKLKNQNSEKTTAKVNPNGSGGILLDINKVAIPEADRMYSIDLSIIVDTIPHGDSLERFTNAITDDQKLKIKVSDISNATIQTKHFKYSWLNGGRWVDGSIINPPQLSRWADTGNLRVTTTTGTSSIQSEFTNTNYEITHEDILDLGTSSIVYSDNLYNLGFTFSVNGNYIVGSISSTSIFANPLNNELNNIADNTNLYPPLSHRSNIYLNRIDGVNNSLFIRGGFFRRQYFSNSTIENLDMDTSNNFSYPNIRKLMIIQNQMTNNNNNTVTNGYFGFSHLTNDYSNENITVKLISHKSAFKNAILDGTITKSAFLSGTFNDGIFTNNKYQQDRDIIPTNNATYSTTSEGVLPGWHSGTFSNGTFDKSIWLNGEFVRGDMLNSEFMGGNWTNGTFGDRSSKSSLNVFRKGHWFNGIFQNGIFSDNSNFVEGINSIYATTSYITTANYYTIEGTNIWEDGNFNNGIFTNIDGEVSLWRGGKFNNGQIVGQVIWEDGIFNNGKFKSEYGKHMPYVLSSIDLASAETDTYVASTPNMRLIDLFDTYQGTMSIIDRYNFGSHGTDNDINDLQVGTLILDTSDDLLKFGYLSNGTASQSPTQRFSRAGYTEFRLDEFFTTPVANTYYMIFDTLDVHSDHPLFNEEKLGTLIIDQSTSDRYVYNGATYTTETSFLSGSISGTPYTYSSIYAWRDGVFNNGEFGDSVNDGNRNPSWENGTFNGGKFYGKIWKDGTFVSGDFNGYGSTQSSISNTIIHKGYDPQETMVRFKGEMVQRGVGTVSSVQINYKNVQDNFNWFGLWLNGEVTINENQNLVSPVVATNRLVDYFNEDKYDRRRQTTARFNRVLWAGGEFNNPDGEFKESIWLKGIFENGSFVDSLFNPYVERWNFEDSYVSNAQFKFEKDTSLSVWNNGTFESGVFYYSDWNNGTFENGTMIGGRFKKGVANYMSAFNTIWEDGRWRNGNFHGSPFTVDNVFGDDSVPNPFEYLGQRFRSENNPPHTLDIIANNSIRLQTEEVHMWNSFTGSNQIPGDYDASVLSHNFSSDTDGFVTVEDTSSALGNLTTGTFAFTITDTATKPNTTPFSVDLTDSARLQSGEYTINIYSNIGLFGPNWFLHFFVVNGTFALKADIYNKTTGVFLSTTTLKTITGNGAQIVTFTVDSNEEYQLYWDIDASSSNFWTTNTVTFFMAIDTVNTDVTYWDTFNNTLKGNIGLSWSGDPIFGSNSIAATTSATYSYVDGYDITHVVDTCQYDVLTFSTPTAYLNAGGAYTMYGNSMFAGTFENGIWNNGWYGDFGYYRSDQFTGLAASFRSGASMSIVANPVYIDTLQPKYRTNPIVFFNDVNRFFKTDSNKWRIVLESAFNIDSTNFTDPYNRLRVGDTITVGNIIGIDINGNRKLIRDLLTIIEIPTTKTIIVEYTESFPLHQIKIDSDRHLITVSKTNWLGGAFLNGYFTNGIFNNGFVRGNRNTTKFENTTFINVNFEGGHVVSERKSLTTAFDNRTSSADLLSPQFNTKYNSEYHSSLIQNMIFNDDVTIEQFTMISPVGVDVTSSGNYKSLTRTGTASHTSLKYTYNSDMDLVYEPTEFSSIFNQDIFNSHINNRSRIGTGVTTEMHNLPAGQITYDVLSSQSSFKYSVNPEEEEGIEYTLQLGSKYKEFNNLFNADFSKSPDETVESGNPSAFNLISGSSYSLIKRGIDLENITIPTGFGVPGISTYGEYPQDVHERVGYLINDNNDKSELGLTGTQENFILSGNGGFNLRNRYSLVEADVEFMDNRTFINPYNNTQTFMITTTYSYGSTTVPKLTISQDYNGLYEYEDGTTQGYLSLYDNDLIPWVETAALSDFNEYTAGRRKFTMKTFIYNNFEGYRDGVKLFEKDFTPDSVGGGTSSSYTIQSSAIHALKHKEVDMIPFFNYRSFNEPDSNYPQWNIFSNGGPNENQDESRSLSTSVKIPFYGSSLFIDYNQSDSRLLVETVNLQGGTNIRSNFLFSVEEDTTTSTTSSQGGNEAS